MKYFEGDEIIITVEVHYIKEANGSSTHTHTHTHTHTKEPHGSSLPFQRVSYTGLSFKRVMSKVLVT